VDVFESLHRSDTVPEVSTGVQIVGPELARHWLETCRYPGQRRLTEARMRLYQQEMAKGLWRLSELRFARLPTGRTFLVNGYTRLAAVIQGGFELPFTITLVDVANASEAAAEYATLDAHRVRQTKDLLRGHELEETIGLSLSDQERVARTAAIVASGFQPISSLAFARTIQFRLPYLLEWAPFARVVTNATHTGHSLDPAGLRIFNAPIFGVALVTARFQPDKALEFWRAVAANDGLRRGDADWVLRDFLARLSTATVRDYPGMERRVAACWNAYMEERQLAFSRVEQNIDGTWSPIKLVGTPYSGQRTIQLYGNGTLIPGTEPEDQRTGAIYARAERQTVKQVSHA
jgi:hypothetical protein